MGRTIGCLGLVFGIGLALAGCSGSSKTTGKDPANEACVAGTRTCDGAMVKLCNEDGAEVLEKTCSAPQTCMNGVCANAGPGICTNDACVETSCAPNTRFCQDGSVWKCDASGSNSKLSQRCVASQLCREADDTATCSQQACKAGEAMCDGDVATTCEVDGSGPRAGGIDCADDKQSCYQGACQDSACTAGQKVCQDGDVYLCAKNGTDTALLVECPNGTVCDGAKLACATKVCDPGVKGCDDTRAVTCNAYGSGWERSANDCAADGKICVAGACKATACTPNGTFCQGGDVFQCDKLGVTSSLWQKCSPNYYHCTPYPSLNHANCEPNECQPNQLLCDGNVARTCNDDGSWPQAGTDCGEDTYCEGGTCRARVCEPGVNFCKDGDIYNCDGNGVESYLAVDCPSDTVCDASAYACTPLPCVPGTTACLANKIGTCATDGKSLSKVTDDCTLSASVCGPDNKCAKSVVDALGDGEDTYTEYSNFVFGDVITVSSARKLTELQMNLVLGSPRELRWVVFEQTSDSTYTARTETKVSNQTGTGFFSSGAFNFSLQAGRTYFFGLRVLGGNTSVAYLDTVPFASEPTFGTLLGRIETDYSSSVYASADSQYAYQMKITTAAP